MSISIFKEIQKADVSRSRFDLSHSYTSAGDFGMLYPVYLEEVVPGDTITGSSTLVMRLSPLIAPMLQQVDAYLHFWFVPNRLVWPGTGNPGTGWEDFITGGEDGTADPSFPTVLHIPAINSLGDYFGLPLTSTQISPSAIPFAAYAMIWNEWYRDQNLQAKLDDTLNDGANNSINRTVQRRAWGHDYLTSCLPFAQKGDQAALPATNINWTYLTTSLFETQGANIGAGTQNTIEVLGDGDTEGNVGSSHAGPWADGRIKNLESITAVAANINDLRRQFAIQQFLEINARAGSRYTEFIKAHFNVQAEDMRLQRPEYLGGGKTPIQISEVLQTSANASQPTPQGNMAGHGVGAGRTGQWTKDVKEHGYIMCLLSVRPRATYSQGMDRHWMKFDKYDYFLPEFENIGEQAVYNYEVFADGSPADNQVFGYNPRYSEYKHNNNRVTNKMRAGQSLEFWAWPRNFATRPSLNDDFIKCEPTSAPFAVANNEKFYFSVYHDIQRSAPMQYFGSPGMQKL